ncbi:MAG: tetratricopeptide repeat protein, partial [Myxococcota bacterium]
MSTWLRMAVVGLVVVAVGASSAAAQDKTCSEKDIARAQLLDVDAGALFDSRDFRAALENWKEAYTLCPNYITAWNIARSYEELLELNQAREAFLLYINAPGVPPEKAKLAQAKIETIAEQVEVWKSLFDSAQSDYDAGDYAKALSGFEAAAGTYAESQTLIRIADCHEQLGHTDDAITTLEDRVLALSSLSTVDR